LRLAIFSAFPQEIKKLLRDFRSVEKSRRHSLVLYFTRYSSREIIVVQTGMGAENTEAALKYVIKEYSPDLLLSVGFGGALYSGASAGDVICAGKVFFIPENVREKSTPYHLELDSKDIPDAAEIVGRLSGKVRMHVGCIFTLQRHMEKSGLRKILPEDLSFPVCDMETYFLARLAREAGLPFLGLRAITDRIDEEIHAEFLSVTDESGKYRLSLALKLILSKPRIIRHIFRIGINARTASNNLSDAVKALIEVL
jgi:adenosylhomocysteine nucleosidase